MSLCYGCGAERGMGHHPSCDGTEYVTSWLDDPSAVFRPQVCPEPVYNFEVMPLPRSSADLIDVEAIRPADARRGDYAQITQAVQHRIRPVTLAAGLGIEVRFDAAVVADPKGATLYVSKARTNALGEIRRLTDEVDVARDEAFEARTIARLVCSSNAKDRNKGRRRARKLGWLR